jgi:hypothetical protein
MPIVPREMTSRQREAQGNRGGPGNPYTKSIGLLRAALLRSVSEKDFEAVVKALVAKAKQGDIGAIRELMDRIVGRPVEADLLERLEALERALPDQSVEGERHGRLA